MPVLSLVVILALLAFHPWMTAAHAVVTKTNVWPVTDGHLKLSCKILQMPGYESLTVDQSWSGVSQLSGGSLVYSVQLERQTHDQNYLTMRPKVSRWVNRADSVDARSAHDSTTLYCTLISWHAFLYNQTLFLWRHPDDLFLLQTLNISFFTYRQPPAEPKNYFRG